MVDRVLETNVILILAQYILALANCLELCYEMVTDTLQLNESRLNMNESKMQVKHLSYQNLCYLAFGRRSHLMYLDFVFIFGQRQITKSSCSLGGGVNHQGNTKCNKCTHNITNFLLLFLQKLFTSFMNQYLIKKPAALNV